MKEELLREAIRTEIKKILKDNLKLYNIHENSALC